MDQLPPELNLVTLNCWGLCYGLSRMRSERLAEIGRQLAILNPPPHIVALQECWSEAEDYATIHRETRAILPHAKFYHAGAFGAGLAILSKWPIEESSMVRFPLSGRPTAFFRGDWFVGKGIACATVRLGPSRNQVVQIFNTHLHAGYREILDSYDSYACHRMSQAWEIAKLVRAASERGRLVIAMGDFNTVPSSIPYRLFTAHAPVRDSWTLVHPNSRSGPILTMPPSLPRRHLPPSDPEGQDQLPPSPSFNVSEHGVTIKSALNTWAWTGRQRRSLIGPDKMPCRVPPDACDNRARRIDYIFVGHLPTISPAAATFESSPPLPSSPPPYRSSDATTGAASSNSPSTSPSAKNVSHSNSSTGDHNATAARSWILSDVSVGMTKRHPLLDVSLSDHFSVHATLKLQALPPTISTLSGSTASSSPIGPGTHSGALTSRRADDAITVDDHIVRSGAFLHMSNSPSASEVNLPDTATSGSGAPNLSYQSHSLPISVSPTDPQLNFSPELYDEVLAAIRYYHSRELGQRRWRFIHFFISLLVGAASLVALCFSPYNWVAFILALVAVVSVAAGCVDGLLALLFFNAELRALSEFEWEIENAKALAMGLGSVPLSLSSLPPPGHHEGLK